MRRHHSGEFTEAGGLASRAGRQVFTGKWSFGGISLFWDLSPGLKAKHLDFLGGRLQILSGSLSQAHVNEINSGNNNKRPILFKATIC